MQSRLATWSTKDRERKFDRLLRLIADRNWLSEAARITLASSGARTPGVDGLDKRMMEVNLQHELATIREELLGGTYQPLPARRVYIPKTNGKLRPLGIPSLRDRIVERAMLMAMEPIWESDFHSASYGFRPARSVHHAIRMVKLQLQDGDERSTAGRWIIEGDLASYFDTVHHRLLIKGIRKRIADQRFLALLWKFIKAGSVDRGLFRAASEGVPQGGVITPLTQKVISSLNEQLRDGEADTPCLIYVLRGNTFMAYEAFDQGGKGSAAKRCSWSAPASSCASRSSAAVVTRVRFVGASSISLPGGSLSARSSRRSSRDHGAGHVEAPAAHGGTAPQVREKQWSDHWSDCDRGLECVSTHPKKAWLSRVEKAAHFKSTFPIRLIACSSRSLRRPTIFWCPVASAPSACA